MSSRSYRSHAHRIDLRDPQNEYAPKQNDQPEGLQNWKKEFLKRNENKWLCDIPNDYIQDRFNTYGIQEEVKDIIKIESSVYFNVIQGNLTSSLPKACEREIIKNLPIVYGLIHARFILSPDGLKAVKNKFKKNVYGSCPRLKCRNVPLLPYGISSKLNKCFVKAFCPCCRELYEPRPANNLDGAFFGPNMAHIFIDEMKRNKELQNFKYVPIIHTAFGFRTRNSGFQQEENDDH